MMKKIVVTLLLYFCYLSAFPCVRILSTLVYEGKEYTLLTELLYSQVYSHPLIKNKLDSILSAQQKPAQDGMIVFSTMRTFDATFEIRDNQLFVKNIWLFNRKEDNKQLKTDIMPILLPDKDELKLDNFDGMLEIGMGDLVVKKTIFSYKSYYDNYLFVEVNDGNIINMTEVAKKEAERLRSRQLTLFK